MPGSGLRLRNVYDRPLFHLVLEEILQTGVRAGDARLSRRRGGRHGGRIRYDQVLPYAYFPCVREVVPLHNPFDGGAVKGRYSGQVVPFFHDVSDRSFRNHRWCRGWNGGSATGTRDDQNLTRANDRIFRQTVGLHQGVQANPLKPGYSR